MKSERKPIRSEADYDEAFAEVERLWDSKLGTPDGDRLEILATLIEAYEDEHYPMPMGSDPSRYMWSSCAQTWRRGV